jgi:hypothetical protein
MYSTAFYTAIQMSYKRGCEFPEQTNFSGSGEREGVNDVGEEMGRVEEATGQNHKMTSLLSILLKY